MAQKPDLPPGKRILLISALGSIFGALAALLGLLTGVDAVGAFLLVGAATAYIYAYSLNRKFPLDSSQGIIVTLGSTLGYLAFFMVGGLVVSAALGAMHAVSSAF